MLARRAATAQGEAMDSRRCAAAVVVAVLAAGCGLSEKRDSSAASGRTEGSECRRFRTATNLSSTPLPAGDAFDDLVSDGTNVYFDGARAVYRVPVVGGALETVYAAPVVALAAGGGVVAWVPASPDTGGPVGLMVEDADGIRDVSLPDGVLPVAFPNMIADANGDVFFEVDEPSGGPRVFRWDPMSGAAAEMPGVGMADGSGTNLYFANRGEIVWAGGGGFDITDMATGTPRPLLDDATAGFGTPIGMDATNVYSAGDICPRGACPFTVYGVPRAGGAPFVAFESGDAYWTNGLQADDTGLYWMDWATRGIFHAALDPAGPAEHVVDPGSGIAQFALDACNLYWLEGNGTQPTASLLAIAK
jgi:hypothetical protein